MRWALTLMTAALILGAAYLALPGMDFLKQTSGPEEQEGRPPSANPLPPDDPKTVVIHYHERIPYMMTIGDNVRGLTADVVERAFTQAGVPHVWVLTPAKRQMEIIKANQGRACIVGWFKTPARSEYGEFSAPLYQDRPHVALVRADNSGFNPGRALRATLADPSLTLLVRDGYSYGGYLDGLIRDLVPNAQVTTGDNTAMVRMLLAGRADYFFIAPEEASAVIDETGLPREYFRLVEFREMPPGNMRYLLYSRAVDEQTRHAVDQAIITIANIPDFRGKTRD